MPATKAIHVREATGNEKALRRLQLGVTRCGRDIEHVLWRWDPNDATCNKCVILIASDKAKHG